jgi:small subunit ribosomal protein S8
MIRNASKAKKVTVEIKRSNLLEVISRILKEQGFISNYKAISDKKQGLLRVYLKYGKDKKPALIGLKKITKPSLRIYKGHKKLPRVLRGIGISIVSTSQGVMTSREARRRKIGGEIICYVW